MRKVNYKEKGITLIALVITIILLLILARVTLVTITGNEGLLKKAQETVKKYKDASEDEANKIAELENYIDSKRIERKTYTIIYDTNEGEGDIETQTKVGGQALKITEEKPTREGYTFLGWAESKEKAGDKKEYYKSGDNLTKDENITLYAVWLKDFVLADAIGKFVDYDVDIDDVEGNYDWKVFYQGTESDGNAKGRIYLIASDYVLNHIIDEKTKNFEMIKTGNFIRYWNKIPNFQDITNNALFMNKYPLTSTSSNVNTKCISVFLNTDNWAGFKDSKGYGQYVTGAPTIEMWCAAWNTIIPSSGKDENGFIKINYKVISGVGYQFIPCVEDGKAISVDGNLLVSNLSSLEKKEVYKLFFPDITYKATVGNITDDCYGYWIASPSCRDSVHKRATMRTDYRGGLSYTGISNGEDTFSSKLYGIRPVVCLKDTTKLVWNEVKEIYMLSE